MPLMPLMPSIPLIDGIVLIDGELGVVELFDVPGVEASHAPVDLGGGLRQAPPGGTAPEPSQGSGRGQRA
ncbi:MAG: hypothetical protein JWL99_4967 [Streptomyces oryziradicis]|nr:hypothetical protein [Actinacidiphila oryziradicis]